MSRRSSIDRKKTDYKPQAGDLVFAKVKGYPPWPARVEAQPPEGTKLQNGRYPVYFFGTYESASIALADLFPYEQHKNTLGKAKKNRTFKIGMQEIEQEYSNCNSITDDNKSEPNDDIDTNLNDNDNDQSVNSTLTNQDDDQQSNEASKPTSNVNDVQSECNEQRKVDQTSHDQQSNAEPTATETEAEVEPDLDESEGDLVIDEKAPTRRKTRMTTKRKKSEISSPHVENKRKSSVKRSRNDSDTTGESPIIINKQKANSIDTQTQCSSNLTTPAPPPAPAPPAPATATPSTPTNVICTPAVVERSRSGRMIKRKRLDDFEENDFSFYERKRKPDAKAAFTIKPEVVAQEDKFKDVSNQVNKNNDLETDIVNTPKNDLILDLDTKENDNINDVPAIITNAIAASANGGLTDSLMNEINNDSIESSNHSQSKSEELDANNSALDITEEKRRKLKLKLERKEKEKEKRKIEKLEQKRLEKWRTICVTSDVLRDIETEIIDSLNINNTNVNRCLHVLKKLDMLPITQQSLLTYTSIVQTLKKCRKYKDERVRHQSELLYNKFKQIVIGDTDESHKTHNRSASRNADHASEDAKEEMVGQEIKQIMDDLLNRLS